MRPASCVVPKLSMPVVVRPASWLDVMAPILAVPRAANSSEETAPSPAADSAPIWVEVKELVALLFVLNNMISASVKPLIAFVVKA